MPQASNHRVESRRAAAPLMVRRRHDADTLTIALCGKLDLATADVLKRESIRRLARSVSRSPTEWLTHADVELVETFRRKKQLRRERN